MKTIFSSFHMKAVALLVCIFLFGINNAHAEIGFGDEVDTFCAGKPGFENPPVFGGLIIENCAKCHNPADKGKDQTPAFDIYKNNGKNPNQALCGLLAPPPTPTCTDADNDGYYQEADCPLGAGNPIDCNDNDPMINPMAAEICTDGKDNNCNNLVDAADPTAQNCPIPNACTDVDKDGYYLEANCGTPVDCNDNNALINPMATEICGDKIDNNCSGKVDLADPAVDKNTCPVPCVDEDNDGYSITGGEYCGPIDCNDADKSVNPGAEEVCSDNVDNNCNGMVDTADQVCPAMGDRTKLEELKAQIKAHKKECKAKEKQLKREYEAFKKQIERAKKEEDDEDEDDEDEDDEDDDEDEGDD